MNRSELTSLIEAGESKYLDFKEILELDSSEKKAEYIKDVVSIANSSRIKGHLLIGIKDNKEVVGCNPPDEEIIQQLANEHINPPINIAYSILDHEQKKILILEVSPTQKPHKVNSRKFNMDKNAVYIRHGSVVAKASPEEIYLLYKENSPNSETDSEFNRLIDNHRKSLEASMINDNEKNYTGVHAIEKIIKIVKKKIEGNILVSARSYICKTNPNDLEDLIYLNLLQARDGDFKLINDRVNGTYENEKSYLKNTLKNLDYNGRWEFIKNYIGSTDTTDVNKLEKLQYISTRNFFKFSFEDRLNDYSLAYEQIYRKFGSSFKLHLNSIIEVINFIDKNKSYRIKYIPLLSKHEKILLFYYMMSEHISCENYLSIHTSNIITDVHDRMDHYNEMVDIGNSHVIKADLLQKYKLCEAEKETSNSNI